MPNSNSFQAASLLRVGDREYEIHRLEALEKAGVANLSRLPYSIKILLENLLRHEDGRSVRAADIEFVAGWDGTPRTREISFMPARVLLQDFTGVPAVVDLAAMRDALKAMGADPKKANPLLPVDLVIDHSVQVDKYGTPDAADLTPPSSSSATGSATPSSAGASRRFKTSASCRPIPASFTR